MEHRSEGADLTYAGGKDLTDAGGRDLTDVGVIQAGRCHTRLFPCLYAGYVSSHVIATRMLCLAWSVRASFTSVCVLIHCRSLVLCITLKGKPTGGSIRGHAPIGME